jgi:hypothetical protein
MKRMHLIVIVVIALILTGLLALRHAVRTSVAVASVSDLPPSPVANAMDAWQAGIKPDTRTDYTSDPATTKRLMEKLRQEELRQRPQEARN